MIYWDANAKRFRDASGRFVSLRTVQIEIEKGFLVTQDQMEALTQRLEDEKIDDDTFQIQFAELIAASLLLAGAVGAGGLKQMVDADFAVINRKVAEQYKFFNNTFANFKKGFKLSNAAKTRIKKAGDKVRQTMKGSTADAIAANVDKAIKKARRAEMFKILKRRARQYAYPMRDAYYQGETAIMKLLGKTESWRVLTAAESCPTCLKWSGKNKGWVLIELQPPIGGNELICRQYCRCFLKYR